MKHLALGSVQDHTMLLQNMGKVIEVDFAAVFDSESLEQEDWSGMVTSCRGCEWVGGCRKWLRAAKRGDECPMQCRNRAALAGLSAKQGALA
ncbi:DUF6455 family protein [Roseovarius rhodophyticola]|uniref:DUF6455 family protein n=1 Tax=Roseovarius rhodophyticola TaxID=3080827 RepID=A0ABZ2TF36_9RHOB|nr:DUF6455 family protein [Roseovarius sp. W115]MDV2930769.1 DUF6455 family protein [Roseovarius sp. W115]